MRAFDLFFHMNARYKLLAALLPTIIGISPAQAQPQGAPYDRALTDQALPTITVHASRFEEVRAGVLPHITLVSADEIHRSGASNVSEVLSRVAGLPMRLNLDGSTNAVVDLRGYGDTASNNMVVLLDGIRLSEHEQSMARTSMIPLEAISHIEISRAGNSVLFGDGANGGTINIITRKNVGQVTVVSGSLASFGGLNSGLFHARDLQDSALSLFARQYASDNYRSNARGTELSAGSSWTKRIDSQTDIGARFFVNRERNKLPGSLPSIWLNSMPRATQVSGYNWDAEVDSHSLTLFGRKRMEDMELAVDFSQRSRRNSDAYSYDAYNVFSGYRYDDWRQSQGSSSSQADVQSLSPRLKISNFILPRNTLQMGYDWHKTSKDGLAKLTFGCSSGSTSSLCANAIPDVGGNNYRFVHQSSGLYFRNTLELSRVDRIVFGQRRESYSQMRTIDYGYGPSAYRAKDTNTASELEYARNFQPNLTAYLRLSRNFRIPNADDNGNVAYAPPLFVEPLLLRVQTSQDVDWGVIHQSGHVQTRVNYFRSHVKNEIGFDPSGCGYACNVNFEPTEREGIQIQQNLDLSKALSLRTNLRFVKARFLEGRYAGNDVPGVPALTGQLSMDYRLSSTERLTWTTRGAKSRYMSGDFDNSQAQIAGYAVQDLSYFFKAKKWSVVASVLNLTNKQHADTGIYKPSYTTPYALTLYPNPGRTFNLSGRYAF